MIEAALRDKILAELERRGLRLTNQRRAIIEAAFATTEHYTAEDLLVQARQRDSTVSRATVYRTLSLLVQAGFLQELDLGRDFTYYDPNYATHPQHNHLICVDCDKIVEFEDSKLEAQENQITKKLGFQPTSKFLRIEATCEELKALGKCSHAKKG